ncbi:DNA methyltransferase [Ferroacidibacillus organovorans]|uniref:Methyltransferase n=1 Tax=Ferroacidibacillus organovorans TaxID=1765683 RepID=A0A101XS54_9BACL|nr:hypothetical protein ATW55_14635 [Ferroacidibacillus organovorans]
MSQLSLYQKDSTAGMSEINTCSIDLILTSPPYWDIIDYKNCNQLGQGLTYKHFMLILKNNIIECMRVLKEDGLAVFVVGDIRKEKNYSGKIGRPRIYPLHSDIIQIFVDMEFDFFQHFIWRKKGVKKGQLKGIIYGSVGSGSLRSMLFRHFFILIF